MTGKHGRTRDSFGTFRPHARLDVLIHWQEAATGLSENGEFLHDLVFYVTGVGLREETAKLALFALFIPWLLRHRTPGKALLTGAFVGLGFALEENQSWQFHEQEYMKAEDYDHFLADMGDWVAVVRPPRLVAPAENSNFGRWSSWSHEGMANPNGNSSRSPSGFFLASPSSSHTPIHGPQTSDPPPRTYRSSTSYCASVSAIGKGMTRTGYFLSPPPARWSSYRTSQNFPANAIALCQPVRLFQ